jgi:hypothetical protein
MLRKSEGSFSRMRGQMQSRRESSNRSEFVRNVGRHPWKWRVTLAWKESAGTLGSQSPSGILAGALGSGVSPLLGRRVPAPLEVAFRLEGHPWKALRDKKKNQNWG